MAIQMRITTLPLLSPKMNGLHEGITLHKKCGTLRRFIKLVFHVSFCFKLMKALNGTCFICKTRKGQQKHYWTTIEETILVESLLELHSDPTWRANTSFKNGYLEKIEAMMEAKLPGCGLKAFPYIQSQIKTLKAKYFVVTELLALSGFEGNKEKMMFVCEKSVYDETTRGKKDANGLYDKAFPHYHTLGEIYVKDRVVGANAGKVDDKEEVRLEYVNENECEDESGYDVDMYFLVPNTLQQKNAESNTSNSSHKRARVEDEIAQQFSAMARTVRTRILN
ncbi:hypothetical protein DVH24_019887 [Malus domestica]|uniref:Myb/SANT-like domain-containing protein n=1 Tax=Malus domestica TaxID=3750 RepID=A0A498I229_MALDO|nr:hypothetical protein DVH24_019887 [Malus domestica]